MKSSRNSVIGPGTRAMLVGVAAFAVYGYLTKPTSVSSLHPSSALATPAAPLWKPEPQLLLARRSELRLSHEQLNKIRAFSEQWEARKRELLAQIEPLITQMKGAGRLSAKTLDADAAGYSELSRLYDRERKRYWDVSLEVLDKAQRVAVHSLKEAGR